MSDDLMMRLRIKCAALSYANDYGPLCAANRGENAAQEALADNLISKLRQVGLRIDFIRPVQTEPELEINWRDDPGAIVEDDEPQIGRDYA